MRRRREPPGDQWERGRGSRDGGGGGGIRDVPAGAGARGRRQDAAGEATAEADLWRDKGRPRRSPPDAAHGGHEPHRPRGPEEDGGQGAGWAHGPNLAQLLRKRTRRHVRHRRFRPHSAVVVLRPAPQRPVRGAAGHGARPRPLQQDRPAVLHDPGGDGGPAPPPGHHRHRRPARRHRPRQRPGRHRPDPGPPLAAGRPPRPIPPTQLASRRGGRPAAPGGDDQEDGHCG